MKNTNFRVTASTNGITIRNTQTGGSVSVKTVNGEMQRNHTGLEGKDHQYGLNVTKFIQSVMNEARYKKMGMKAAYAKLAEVFKGVADSTNFRNLSNRSRKFAEDNGVTKVGQFFYEINRG